MAVPETRTPAAPSVHERPPDAQSDAYLAWLRALLWPDRVERFGGGLLVSSAPVPEHQLAVADLSAWLVAWCRQTGLGEALSGTELRLAREGRPRPVRRRAPDNGVPDLLLYRFANPRCRRVPSGPRGRPAGYVEGAPDLLVEVLSPSTDEYDLTVKRRAFAAAGGPEYWVLDWTARTAQVLTWPEGDDYQDEAAVPWEELRWPPAGEPGSVRWGDYPLFPSAGGT